MAETSVHIPVMLPEVLEMFAQGPQHPRKMLDGTFGRGGHTQALLKKYPDLEVMAVDQDLSAIDYGTKNIEPLFAGRLRFFHGTFAKYMEQNKDAFDLILLDLGVSSPQLDEAERGFSFYHNGPLDMRMNREQKVSAETIINTWDEEDLIDVFKNYGEVRSPYRVIRAILFDRQTKPFTTTHQLAGLIERVEGWRQKGKHPSTQYFLGLRLRLNQELESVQESLPLMIRSLVPGGVLAVISFHSLEDRIVKNIFKDHDDLGYRINKKVIVASDEEQQKNPRSRSAKLRGFLRGKSEENLQLD
jgi:16S rRNA (cytosine1402-N4)-methyltransferase